MDQVAVYNALLFFAVSAQIIAVTSTVLAIAAIVREERKQRRRDRVQKVVERLSR